VDLLAAKLNATGSFECGFLKTCTVHILRSDYLDIRLVNRATARMPYLDPKLHAKGSVTFCCEFFISC